MKKIILASGSPRRKELLETMGLPFEVITGDVDETVDSAISPYDCVKIVSNKKAYAVLEKTEGEAVIIAADTIVTYLGRILQKPESRHEAIEMLRMLQGKSHTVYTGVTVLFRDADGAVEEASFVNSTDVIMHSLTDQEIEAYADTGECLDKAGAYGIQGRGAVLIEGIHGDYYTVMGLPVPQLYLLLKQHGVDVMKYWKG